MTRDDMKRVLNAEMCTVVFTKKNGEERIMECTTRSDMIPANHLSSKEGTARKENTDVVVAYDVRKADWRSFRVDSVKSFNGVTV
jgi:hypothetical protein